MSTALQVDQLSKNYPTRTGALSVLSQVSFEMQDGDQMAITGPSGSGKSTLLHILGTLDRPNQGKVLLDNQDPFLLTERELARFRNQKIGFIFQDHHLLPQCNVLENVLIPTIVDPTCESEQVQREATKLLERVGLQHRLDHRPAELSGGERQRVAIARALIRKPRLLLADEPTGNLDRNTAQSISEILFELPREQHTMLIVVTHSHELAGRFDRRYEIIEGRLSTSH